MKILILGQGEHGKDEFAARLSEKTNMRFMSSSQFAADHVIYPWFESHLPNCYASSKECFSDRRNWRTLWHNLIAEYNTPDKAKLARELIKENDMYVGMRAVDEVQACVDESMFDRIFWVTATGRVKTEDKSSCSVQYNPDTMVLIDNTGDLKQLQREVEWASGLLKS